MGNPKPLLIVSDAVAAPTGLARITRDLATRIYANLGDVYRIATAGHGAVCSSRFPWMQYPLEGMRDWVLPSLPETCEDHFRGENGIIWFIWDLARIGWFAQTENFPEPLDPFPSLHHWLKSFKVEKWVYAPIDAEGPGGRLSYPLAKASVGFDRIFAYGQWARGVVEKAIGPVESEKRHLVGIPHGIDSDIFFEMPHAGCRKLFFNRTNAQPLLEEKPRPIQHDELLIGIVATNNSRKDWALGFEVVAKLAEKRPVRLWIHTDILERGWSLSTLMVDFKIIDKVVISLGYLPDERMAEAYSACDVTLGIGSEGFGYPLAESQACGTPVVHGAYAGGAEIVPEYMQVKPAAYRYEGLYGCKRPVFNAEDWADKVEELAGKRVSLDPRLEWPNLWPVWEAHLREAAK